MAHYRCDLRPRADVLPARETGSPAVSRTGRGVWRRRRESTLQPGGYAAFRAFRQSVSGKAGAISEGQRLFGWYNCSGCHANGGGGIGPPLIKTEWIYGGEPANIFDTIVKGRPNGMPTWGGRIPEYQIWQIVAYVRSLNNEEPQSATPARTDTIQNRLRLPSTNKVWGADEMNRAAAVAGIAALFWPLAAATSNRSSIPRARSPPRSNRCGGSSLAAGRHLRHRDCYRC